jgi:hypothetical protein
MLNQKKAPGLELITATVLKELPKAGLVNLIIYSTPYYDSNTCLNH